MPISINPKTRELVAACDSPHCLHNTIRYYSGGQPETHALIFQGELTQAGWRTDQGKLYCPICDPTRDPRNLQAPEAIMKPCPFCGSTDIRNTNPNVTDFVSCGSCLADGPVSDDPIAAWNKRA